MSSAPVAAPASAEPRRNPFGVLLKTRELGIVLVVEEAEDDE